MKKRILSIVLAVLMLVSLLPVTALAAGPVTDYSTVTEQDGNVTVKKTAVWTDKTQGKAKITFELTGGTSTSTEIAKTDIVLVIDCSGSMEGKRMTEAKKAATSFVEKFLGTSAPQNYKDNVRIAIVPYATDVQTGCGLTNQRDTLNSTIKYLNAYGGTHIQAGIHKARMLLQSSDATNKIMVVLTDGEPTYSYPFVASGGEYKNCESWGIITDCYGGTFTKIGEFAPDYSDGVGDGRNYSCKNAIVSAKCSQHYEMVKEYGSYDVTTGRYTKDGSSNHGVATIWEADQARTNEKAIIYGIGVGKLSTNATNTMKKVANSDAHYFPAADSGDAIQSAFDSIATQVTTAMAKDVTLSDKLATGFTLTAGGITYADSNVGNLSGTPTKIEIPIQYDINNPSSEPMLSTNDLATITYKDANDKSHIITLTQSPKLDNPAVKVSYNDGYTTDNSGLPNEPQYADKYYWPGKGATVAAEITRAGYVFNGWKPEGTTVTDGKFIAADKDITFTATWIEDESTVAYNITKEWDGKVGKSATFQITYNGGETVYGEETLTVADQDGTDTNKWVKSVDLPVWQLDKNGAKHRAVYQVTETKINDTALDDNGKVNEVNQEGLVTGTWTSEAITNGAKNTYQAAQTYEVTYGWATAAPSSAKLPTGTTGLLAGSTYTVTAGDYEDVKGANAYGVPGTWKFLGWQNGTDKVEKDDVILVTGNIEILGSWEFTADTFSVTYQYTTSDKPSDVSLPTGETNLAYNAKHTVDDTQSTDETAYKGVPGSWSFSGWYNGTTPVRGEIEVTENITLTGTWTFTPNSMVTLHYEIVVMDAGAPQPKHGTVTQPDDQTGYSGTDFNVAGSATTTDDTYAWTFHGWYTDDACSNPAGASITLTGNTTLYGYWTSEAKVGAYTVTEFLMQANGAYDAGTEIVTDGTHALGEMTYTPAAKTGYTLNTKMSELTKEITADGTAEFKVYYDLSSGSKVTKVAKVNGVETTEADVGDTIDYYITVSNVGGLDLKNLELTDTFNRADLHFDESEGYTVTKAEGEEGKWTITIPSLTVAEDSITIHATYKVVDTDSGRTLRNIVGGTGDDTDGSSTVTVGEVTHNNVVIDIEKTVTSKRGTAPKEGYVFVAYYVDESENEHELGRTTIYMSESATKDDPKTETGKIRFTLSKEEYAMLPKEKVSEDGEEEAGIPYLYVRELPGEDAFTEYDSTVLKGYVIPAPVAYSILPDEPTYKEVEYIVAPETNLFGSVFAFENIYKKSTSRVDPIKVGPQLNRDDHVAYIMGYPDGTVQPEGQITRAEACTIFFRLLTDSSRDYYFSKTNDYTDVNAGDWFNNAISTLSNAGIVTGYNDGTFRPNQPITRGEMAKIIANFANLKYGGKTFTDLAGHWSKSYVELAAGNGWIAGYPDGSFRPDQKITRAETVTMINRVLDRVPAKESRLLSRSIMLTFPDNNPGDWYYIAIQEASNSHEYQRSVYETTGDEMWTKLIDNVDWTKLEK